MKEHIRQIGSCYMAGQWNSKFWHFAAIACMAASIAIPCEAEPLSQADKRTVVEKAGELLTANYIFPERAVAANAKIDAALRAGEYETIASPEAFAEKLTSDLQSVTHDGHLRVLPPPVPRLPVVAASPTAPSPLRVYAGFSHIDRLKGNIGYIKMENIPDTTGPFRETATKAIADLAGTDALIIDMRDNGGGSTASVIYLCSFFFDPKTPVHLDSEISRKPGTDEFQTKEIFTQSVPVSYLGKPIYLLTNKRTRSAAERFLYDLQTQNRARLIGEVTSGSANGTEGHPLPFRFMIGIPFQRTVNPITKTNFEGTGVKPDLAVDDAVAFQAAMREIVASNPAKYAALETKVDSRGAEDSFVEASLLQFRDKPQPGGEAAVRTLLFDIATGKPDYSQMSDELAQTVRGDFDFFQKDMSDLGEVKSVKFTGVNAMGLDDYEVRTATARKRFAIYLTPDGKIAAARFYPTVPLPAQP